MLTISTVNGILLKLRFQVLNSCNRIREPFPQNSLFFGAQHKNHFVMFTDKQRNNRKLINILIIRKGI